MQEYESEMGWYALYLRQWQGFGRKYERPTEPTAPEAERFMVSDVRIDTLVDLLAASPEGLAMLHDDLAGWLDKYDARPDSKGSKLRSMWSGKSLMKDHGKRSIYIEHPSVSMAGGIQPAALRRAITRDNCEDGLIARLLVSMPSTQRTVGCSGATVSPETEAQLAELFDVLWTMKYHCGAIGQPIPSVVELSEEAHDEWIQFSDRHQAEQAELSGYLAGMWASLEAYAARFALVIHICRRAEGQSVDPMLIDAGSLRAAVRLADWFGGEAWRVYTMLVATSDIDDPDERTLALIRRRKGRITARELRQFDRRFRNDAAGAEAELNRMAESNFGSWETINGRRSKREFVLSQAAKPSNPDGDVEASGAVIGLKKVAFGFQARDRHLLSDKFSQKRQ